ncbi:MAG: gamma-glutamyl-gamma-aminobutyrate hydrolase family protein [Phycisphaerales bacterium]|nr:gamma-glutamyl-gamma-aminobutyrate hydrolase family protein [Phycisphaerales bacterium]
MSPCSGPDFGVPRITRIDHDLPLIGVTADLVEDQARLRGGYARSIAECGGIAIPLFPLPGSAASVLPHLDGVIFSGGDDPDTTNFGDPVHPKATLIDPIRQAFELELLDALERSHPEIPVLGICLGMQMLGLHAGGRLNQHLPDDLETADQHRDGAIHEVTGARFTGRVHSHHVQALEDPGRLKVVGEAPDGVIEAIESTDRPFVLGVQWHPERSTDPRTGSEVFRSLLDACREEMAS